MRQSIHLSRRLPALLCLAVLYTTLATTLHGQETHRLKWNENFRRDPDPNGALLASVEGGTVVPASGQQGAWVQIVLEGWIWSQSVRADSREGHDLVVAVRNAENLRTEPNGTIIARLASGALLDEVERQGAWVKVRRAGWMFGQSLETVRTDGQTDRRAVGQDGSEAPPSTSVGLDRGVTRDSTVLHRVPEGPPAGTLAAEAPVKVLARTGGWVRVQTEGWIREEDLKPSARGVLLGVSAAELRSRPQEFVGKVLQWTVQFIAIKPPDDLRPEIPEGRPYILARGPQPEQGFLYLIVTDAQLARFRQLPELAELVLLGRVRVAKSRYLQLPVLELMEMQVK
jgi:hypothetical protein